MRKNSKNAAAIAIVIGFAVFPTAGCGKPQTGFTPRELTYDEFCGVFDPEALKNYIDGLDRLQLTISQSDGSACLNIDYSEEDFYAFYSGPLVKVSKTDDNYYLTSEQGVSVRIDYERARDLAGSWVNGLVGDISRPVAQKEGYRYTVTEIEESVYRLDESKDDVSNAYFYDGDGKLTRCEKSDGSSGYTVGLTYQAEFARDDNIANANYDVTDTAVLKEYAGIAASYKYSFTAEDTEKSPRIVEVSTTVNDEKQTYSLLDYDSVNGRIDYFYRYSYEEKTEYCLRYNAEKNKYNLNYYSSGVIDGYLFDSLDAEVYPVLKTVLAQAESIRQTEFYVSYESLNAGLETGDWLTGACGYSEGSDVIVQGKSGNDAVGYTLNVVTHCIEKIFETSTTGVETVTVLNLDGYDYENLYDLKEYHHF